MFVPLYYVFFEISDWSSKGDFESSISKPLLTIKQTLLTLNVLKLQRYSEGAREMSDELDEEFWMSTITRDVSLWSFAEIKLTPSQND